jgi:dipeptidyl aminopeptidase/acylaminoacyl peptidase
MSKSVLLLHSYFRQIARGSQGPSLKASPGGRSFQGVETPCSFPFSGANQSAETGGRSSPTTQKHPSAAEADADTNRVAARLKSCPFKAKTQMAAPTSSFAAWKGLCCPYPAMVLGVLFILVSAAPIAAQAKRPMTFEDMMKMKRLGETAVSADGKWLAYGVTTVNLEANSKTAELWLQTIAPASGSDPAPLKIAVSGPGDSGVQFSADGKRILFLSDREGGRQQVFAADFDGAMGATSNTKKLTAISTEADNAQWSRDGRFVVFTSSVYPDCPAITAADASTGDKCNADRDAAAAASKVKAQIFTHLLYRHWNHFTGDKRSHLFLLSVESGAVRDLTPNDAHDVPPFSIGGGGGFAISPDSKELAFTENPDAEPATSVSAQIYTLDLTDAAAKPVKVSTSAGGNFNPAYSPDGKWLAWRSQARAGYESDKFRLMIYDRVKKAGWDLSPIWENSVDEFAWGPDSKRVFVVSGQKGESPVLIANLEGHSNELYDRGELSGLHPLADGKTILASTMKVDRPAEVLKIAYSWDYSTERGDDIVTNNANVDISHLTHLNDELLAKLDQPKMESFWFTAEDKTKLQGFLIRPPGFDAAKKYPVKFLIHGGPQGAWGDAWSYRWNAELFAANGYVVVMINPRGSTGYGQVVVDGVNGDWGGKPFSDLMLGLDYAEQHYGFIDKNRECALGASYGGYMANWVLGHTDRFKCIVSHDGMFDAESAFGSTEEDWFNIWEFKGNPWDYYGKPDAENPFRKFSPSLYAKNFKTPTLVIHSQLDYRLDVSEGFQLFDTLQLLKVPSKMLYFPDEGHWVMKPQNSQLWYKTVNDWVDEWVKPRD